MLFRICRAVTCFLLLPSSFLIQSAPAQIQQAWVAHYNNGILNGTNQAVKMALDPAGNIYVTGVSQNTNTNLGYVTIKYAPNGNQLWASQFDSTNYPAATPSGLVLDSSNNVIVTGNALTVKYDANGNELWVAPYDGSAITIDPGGNPIVTGVGSNFTTVKLNPTGSNLWQTTYPDPVGPAWSQVVLADTGGNVYVAGSYT
jgi:outer membrane protein assembly factor BamB